MHTSGLWTKVQQTLIGSLTIINKTHIDAVEIYLQGLIRWYWHVVYSKPIPTYSLIDVISVVLLKGIYSTLKYKAILNNFLTRVEEGQSIQCPMKTDKKTNNSQQNTTQK
jgi:hypothetical protein